MHEYYAAICGSEVANRIVIDVLGQLESLMTFSGLGRPSQSPGVRELVLSRYPYVAPYRLKGDQVQVLRVLHHRTDR
ncbi:type II toxin-antitoxin system RelE/ParE family toxin [Pseudomonas sp. NPDC078416]|uniref:type II toxin-antitoxin system RelE/ParE family toxin n=1 Tax=Pseudomonas sp. NPDC078416 TaxID=3390637 RepID=UPI003CFBD709